MAHRRGPRPADGQDPDRHLELRLDERDVSLGRLRQGSPPTIRDSNPPRLREIRPTFEYAIDRLDRGEYPHARGELFDNASVLPVPDAHTDSIEAPEHV